MKKKFLSLVLVMSIIASLFVAMPMMASAQATYERIAVTYNYQVVDSLDGVDAVYLPGTGNTDTGAYCCAGYVSKYYSNLYGVTVNGLVTGSTPKASSGYFYEVDTPEKGDIVNHLNSSGSGHWMICKSFSGNSVTVIEQNWKWKSGSTTYAAKNRTFTKSDYNSVKYYRWSEKPDPTPSPVDLGDDFYAVILQRQAWIPLVCDDDKFVRLHTGTGCAKELWRFKRQDDGSYLILSAQTGNALELHNGERVEGNTVCANNPDWGGYYQRWFIYEQDNGYVLMSKHFSDEKWVLDLRHDQKTDGTDVIIYPRNNSDVQIWGIYKGEECHLSSPELSVSAGTDSTKTSFSWTNVNGESGYRVQIWKDKTYWDGNPYKSIDVNSSKCDVQLPPGNYQAYVDAKNYFDIKMSNVVSFHVGKYTDITPGIYSIHSAWDDNMLMDIYEDSKENRANIQLYQNVNNIVQKFKVIKEEDHYVIKSIYANKWLDISTSGGIKDNSNVQLWESKSNPEEKWYFEDAGNGYVYIKSSTGYYLDVQGDKAVNNANLQVYHFVGNNSQKWRMEKIEFPKPKLTPEKLLLTKNEVTTFNYCNVSTADEVKIFFYRDGSVVYSPTIDKKGTHSQQFTIVGECQVYIGARYGTEWVYSDKINIIVTEEPTTKTKVIGNIITTSAVNIPNNSKVIIATYTDNKLEEIFINSFVGNDISVQTKKNYTSVKVMVWDGLNTLVPLTSPEVISQDNRTN